MDVLRQSTVEKDPAEKGPRARMRRLLLQTAVQLMQNGMTPSVSDAAEAAGVSRATAYRYFPSQAALVQAVVGEALGPILDWKSKSTDAERRVIDLFETGAPRLDEFEATFRAALRLSLDQWAKRQAGTLGSEPAFVRGHRIERLNTALAPLQGKLSSRKLDRLNQALSLLFGVEALVVLKDIWGLNIAESLSVTRWVASVLVKEVTNHIDN